MGRGGVRGYSPGHDQPSCRFGAPQRLKAASRASVLARLDRADGDGVAPVTGRSLPLQSQSVRAGQQDRPHAPEDDSRATRNA